MRDHEAFWLIDGGGAKVKTKFKKQPLSGAAKLSMLQIHLSEEHGPLGRFPFVTGEAWDDYDALEAAHKTLHLTREWGHRH